MHIRAWEVIKIIQLLYGKNQEFSEQEAEVQAGFRGSRFRGENVSS